MYATEQLKEGDRIEIHQPEGKIILEPEGGRHYIAFALARNYSCFIDD